MNTQKLQVVKNNSNIDKDVDFEMPVVVTSDITNAEGNVTHYEYVRLFSQALERYVGRKISVQATPMNMTFKYMKDILPGQAIIVKLWVHKQDHEENIVFMAEFVDAKTSVVHALGVQEIYAEKRNHSLVGQVRKSKATTQFTRLKKWIEEINGKIISRRAKYVLKQKKIICFGRTSCFGTMCAFEYANIFGEVREAFGLNCIPNFKKDVGKQFILITNDAQYSVTRHFQFGDKITIKMWVENFSRASFTLRAEFWNGKHFCGVASQKIAYYNLLTKKLGLPESLRKQLKMVSGHSPVSVITSRAISLLMPFKFLLK